jgi:hypothetical protein
MSHRSISKRATRRLTVAATRARLQSRYEAAAQAELAADAELDEWDARMRALDAAGSYQGWGGMHRASLCLTKNEARDAAQAAYEALVRFDWRHCHHHETPT